MRRPPLILHYHAIGCVPRRHDPHNLVIAPEELTVQLATLRRRGYRFVSLADLVSRLPWSAQGMAALTFDDGSLDNLNLLPALLAGFSAPATVYACPGLLGRPHHAIAPEAGVRLMTASELRELAALPGFEIGAHTRLHIDLVGASREEAFAEMVACRIELEAVLDHPVSSFAYPFCRYSPACPAAAQAAGYANAVTCGQRGSWAPFELRRVSPDRLDTRLTFALRSRYLFDRLRSAPMTRSVGRLMRRRKVRERHG